MEKPKSGQAVINEPDEPLVLKHGAGVVLDFGVEIQGSFKSSDERLDRIWKIGAYTVHRNTQDYLWDGIRRDRLVWLGDIHPEVSVISAVFGYNEVVPRSLDMIREVTPVTEWMNGISSCSMWWITILEDWYRHNGDLDYFKQPDGSIVSKIELPPGIEQVKWAERVAIPAQYALSLWWWRWGRDRVVEKMGSTRALTCRFRRPRLIPAD